MSAKDELDDVLDVEGIKERLPLRYPYLMIDRVLQLSEEKIVAVKNVTINEPYFQGHFPEPRPSVVPGTIILEGMAQTVGLFAMEKSSRRGMGYFAAADGVKFRKPVVPGDRIRYVAKLERMRKRVCRADVTALVEEEKAAEGRLTLTIGGEGEN